MRTGAPLGILPALLLALTLGALPTALHAQGATFTYGAWAGYQGGVAAQAFVQVRDFAQGLPLEARLRVGRTSVEPGSAAAARRIFINNATNGTPVERGRTLDLGLDLILPRGEHRRVWAGVRRTAFLANFRYVGGNEDFDVTSAHWGLAAGMELSWPVGRRLDLLVSGGGEGYFASRLQGHDTSYSPDGDDVNPQEEYVYADADEAVSQPSWRPVVLVGLSWRPGR